MFGRVLRVRTIEGQRFRDATTLCATVVLNMAASGSQNAEWYSSHYCRQYDFPCDRIPRLSHLDPEADRLIANDVSFFCKVFLR